MKAKNIFLLILLASCWGPSFLFIKIAVAEVSPLMLTGLRIGLGALILNLILLVRRERLPLKFDFWKKIFIAGFFAQALPFTLINWGEQYVDSSLASLLNGLTPLSTIVLAQMMLADERMNENKLKGVLLGFVGLVILVLPSLVGGVAGTTQGILSITLGAISYGVGVVYIRKNLVKSPPMHAPAAQLLSVAVYTLPIAFFLEPSFTFTSLSWEVIGSIAILGSFGTAIAFIIYFKLLERTSASYLSMVTYLMSIYGVVLGIVFLNERVSIWTLVGAAFIFTGIMLVNRVSSKRSRFFRTFEGACFTK